MSFSKAFIAFAVLCAAVAVGMVNAMPTACETWTDPSSAGYTISETGRDYDSDSNSTTFCWNVTVANGGSEIKALSHWVVGLCEDTTLADVISSTDDGAPRSIGVDPTTGLYGFKWDGGLDKGSTFEYCLELRGNIPLASEDATMTTNITYKGGRVCSSEHIDGPGCGHNQGGCTPVECPPGQTQNEESCLCECANECGAGKAPNPDNACECECLLQDSCPEGKSRDSETCACECTDQSECGEGKSRNEETCECECDAAEACPEGKVRNNETCGCECADTTPCFYGQSRNEATCQCECDDNDAQMASCLASPTPSTWHPAPFCICLPEGDVPPPPPPPGCIEVIAKCGCPLIKRWEDGDCVSIKWVTSEDGQCDE